jgi:hypothetical protein
MRGFPEFVALVRARRPTLSGSLAQVRPLMFRPGLVELGCETRFDEDKLGSHDTKSYLEELLAEHFGTKTELRVSRVSRPRAPSVVPEPTPSGMPPTLTEVEEAARLARKQELEQEAGKRPAVQAVESEFEAKVTRVELVDDSGRRDG